MHMYQWKQFTFTDKCTQFLRLKLFGRDKDNVPAIDSYIIHLFIALEKSQL